MNDCLDDIISWSSRNFLKLNPDKSQFICFGTRQQLTKLQPLITSISLPHISTSQFCSRITLLGVTLDSSLTLMDHARFVANKCRYELRQLWSIRKCLNADVARSLVNLFIVNRLDYCNAIFFNASKEVLDVLQSVQNAAARLVLQKRKFDPISNDIRTILHWLPCSKRIQFKIALLTFKCLTGQAPAYLTSHCNRVASGYLTRGSVSNTLLLPSSKLTSGQRRFAYAAPKIWNALPLHLRNSNLSLDLFKSHLKTFLFTSSYDA